MENGQRPTHLRFVWTTNGYELREREGDVPAVGEEVEEDDGTSWSGVRFGFGERRA